MSRKAMKVLALAAIAAVGVAACGNSGSSSSSGTKASGKTLVIEGRGHLVAALVGHVLQGVRNIGRAHARQHR